MISELNYVQVKAANIINSYISAPNTNKIWTLLGPGFWIVSNQEVFDSEIN